MTQNAKVLNRKAKVFVNLKIQVFTRIYLLYGILTVDMEREKT